MVRPLALITGGNSGIGQAAAAGLVADGWDLLLASRDLAASQQVAAALSDGLATVTAAALDLEDPDSIDRFAASLPDRPLQAVFCNAGLSHAGALQRTAEGLERNVAVNLVGHARLVHHLLPRLAPRASIVFTGSGTGRLEEDAGPMKVPRWPGAAELLRPTRDDTDMADRRYPTSKLAVSLYSQELRRRLADGRVDAAPGVTVLLYEPGFVPGTGLGREDGGLAGFAFEHLLPHMHWAMKGIRTPEQAGAALAALAALAEAEVEAEAGADPALLHTVDGPLPMPGVYADEGRGAELWAAVAAELEALAR